EMQETRGFEFVAIDILPSKEDTATNKTNIEKVKEGFKSAINDSLFVINNSDNPVFNEGFVAPNTFGIEMDTMIQKAKVGDVVGPYLGAGFWQIAKVLQSDSAYEAKVRHILISVNPQNPADGFLKKAKADSIKDVWTAKGNFSELLKFSTDVDKDGVANNDGLYDWFSYGAMVPEFEEYSMTGELGIVEVVQTQFGYHVMEVLGRRTNGKMRIKAPVIQRNIVPGEDQIGVFKDSAYRFIQAAKESDDFEEYCKSKGFFAGISNEPNIVVTRPFMNNPVLQNSTNILRWAFNAELNEISDYFEMNGSYKLVVAKLTQNIPEGLPSFETAKQVMEVEVTNVVKGKYLASQAANITDLNALTQKWGGNIAVQSATGVSFKDKNLDPLPLPQQQQQQQQQKPDEAEVMGTIFTLEPGKLSTPITGSTGMYVLMVDAFVPITKQKEDFITEKITLESELRARADSGVMRALIDKADVKDYRKKNELIDSK
ncbi:MAG: peptidyl-prolyl cis-trans isomerase D, partial [Parvicellaceae bacterium]